MYSVWRHFNKTRVAWAVRKRNRKTWASIFLENISRKQPSLIAHWRAGIAGAFS